MLIEGVLRQLGVTRDELAHRASQVVLFGSRACAVATPTSDWDVLCIGNGVSRRTAGLDLLWVPASALCSSEWLGSELASHVAAYGTWLWGPDDWRHDVAIAPSAAERKLAGTLLQLAELERLWPLLVRRARERHLLRLRREVQRFHLLASRIPVPPSAHLDRAWARIGRACAHPGELRELLVRAPALPRLSSAAPATAP
jgi:hypothetical protein